MSCLALPSFSSSPPAPMYFMTPVRIPKKPNPATKGIIELRMEIKLFTNWLRLVGGRRFGSGTNCAKTKSGRYEDRNSTVILKYVKNRVCSKKCWCDFLNSYFRIFLIILT